MVTCHKEYFIFKSEIIMQVSTLFVFNQRKVMGEHKANKLNKCSWGTKPMEMHETVE